MWIEIITVRTTRIKQCASLLDELAVFRKETSLVNPDWLDCYQNLEVENEISIHLGWEEKGLPVGKSAFGLQIARYLAQHGLVHHSLWKPTMIH
jgi:hypothetical protein